MTAICLMAIVTEALAGPFDAADPDVAPDDGIDMNTANDGPDKPATMFVVCKG